MGRAGDSLVHDSPHEVGDEAFTVWIRCREITGWPVGKMVVVVVVVVVESY